MSKTYVAVTDEIRSFLEKYATEAQLKENLISNSVELSWIYKFLSDYNSKANADDRVDVAQMMHASHVTNHIAAPPPKLSATEKLRLKAQEETYQKSLSKIPALKSASKDTFADLSKSVSFAANFIMVLGGSFLVGFFACQTFYPESPLDRKMIWGLVMGVVCLMMEVAILILADFRAYNKSPIHLAKEKIKRLQEKREVFEQKQREMAIKMSEKDEDNKKVSHVFSETVAMSEGIESDEKSASEGIRHRKK